MSIKRTQTDEQKEKIKVRSPKNRRPYGLLAQAGIRSAGMTPGEAWDTWNYYQKRLREHQAVIKPQESARATIQLQANAPVKSQVKKVASGVTIPKLNADQISQANGNSFFNRGAVSESEYNSLANQILQMEISDAKKEKLLGELHKRWSVLLGYEAAWVPATVAGPSKYNARKYDKGDQVMSTRREISEWFSGVKKSVKNSKSQYNDEAERKRKAEREEERLNRAIERGWYSRPTDIATGIAAIAPYDPERFVELYESYDKKYHFRKGTNAAKLYEQTKAGKYKGVKKPQKLHETENLNTYKKKIQAGERVFMKFTTRPKPQLIYALKKRGWHWNSNEQAWSIDSKKYDADFVVGIDENYKKYL